MPVQNAEEGPAAGKRAEAAATNLGLSLAQRLADRVPQAVHAMHLRLQLLHAVILHPPPLQRSVVPGRGGRRAGLCRRGEGEAGLVAQGALEGVAAVRAGSSLQTGAGASQSQPNTYPCACAVPS